MDTLHLVGLQEVCLVENGPIGRGKCSGNLLGFHERGLCIQQAFKEIVCLTENCWVVLGNLITHE